MRDPLTNRDTLLTRSIAHIESCLDYQTTKRFWHVLTKVQQARSRLAKTKDLINDRPSAVRTQLRQHYGVDGPSLWQQQTD